MWITTGEGLLNLEHIAETRLVENEETGGAQLIFIHSSGKRSSILHFEKSSTAEDYLDDLIGALEARTILQVGEGIRI